MHDGKKALAQGPRRFLPQAMRTFLTAALFVLAACAPDRTTIQPIAVPAETPEQRATRILSEVPLADGHNDWAIALRGKYGLEGAKVADPQPAPRSPATPPSPSCARVRSACSSGPPMCRPVSRPRKR